VGQVNTIARAEALADPRLALKMAICLLAVASNTPDQLFWNNDGSVMVSQSDGHGAEMVRIVSSKDTKEIRGALQSTTHQQSLPICIKWEQLANAGNGMGRICLIIAIKGMESGDFLRFDCPGLTNTMDVTQKGVIYFAPTRCMKPVEGKPSGWVDYFRYVVIPDMKKVRDALQLKDEFGELHDSVGTIDGESTILNNLLLDELQEELHAESITVVKVVPGGTAKHNACDAADNFRDKNAGLRYLEQHPSVPYTDNYLGEQLKGIFTQLRASRPSLDIPASFIKKAIDGVQKFRWVSSNGGYVTPHKTGEGFSRSGQRIPAGVTPERTVPGYENSKRHFHHIITRLCTTKLSDADIDNIYDHAPEMIVSCRARGRLEDEVLNGMNIVSLPPGEHKDRDELTLCQQGPTIITHARTVERFKAWATRREDNAREKERKAAQDELDKIAANEAKKEDTKRRNEEERARFKALPKDQQKMEKDAKRLATNGKRQETADAKALKVAELRVKAGVDV
jgi:hypothetical protein